MTRGEQGVKIWQNIFVCGAAFAAAVIFFCLGHLVGDRLGLVSDLIAIAGGATCGWSWLLARALFQSDRTQAAVWPVAVVFTLIATDVLLRLAGDAGPVLRMIGNIQTLTSSTVLLLALIEPFRGFHSGLPKGEQRFRFAFAAGYLALLAVSVLWVNGSPAGGLTALWGEQIKMVCAAIGVIVAGLAVWYRHRHPLLDQGRAKRRVLSPDDGLGARILSLMTAAAIYAEPDLKVADLARRVGEAEYKVTQCITGTLGFRNFNHMINHFRIAEAKVRLSDPRCGHLPVLTIALDCGFGSIGPFNRAFKAETGLTPTAFRDQQGLKAA